MCPTRFGDTRTDMDFSAIIDQPCPALSKDYLKITAQAVIVTYYMTLEMEKMGR